jgi:hypothetical protein
MAQTCNVQGVVYDGASNLVSGALIYASPVNNNIILDTSTGSYVGISRVPYRDVSGLDGSFYLPLIRNSLYRVVIKYICFDEVILVPDLESVNLFTLVGSNSIVIPTSTGNVVIGGTEAGW